MKSLCPLKVCPFDSRRYITPKFCEDYTQFKLAPGGKICTNCYTEITSSTDSPSTSNLITTRDPIDQDATFQTPEEKQRAIETALNALDVDSELEINRH